MLIELQNIHKSFGSLKANTGIDLTVEPGQIHGILGENGAGKSTLMKILSGYSRPTTGDIRVDGQPVRINSPIEAAARGIGMLYQEPLDFPRMTVLDNFILGQSVCAPMQRPAYGQRLRELADRFEFNLYPDAKLTELTVGERQQLEILRLLSLGINVLILDEPTTGISDTQKTLLFNALKKLTAEQKSILLVSHKLEDVEALCDCITVLRQGTVSGKRAHPFQTFELLEMMFGTPPVPPRTIHSDPGQIVLSLRQISAMGGRTGLDDCTVDLYQGQVIGLAGLEGSGQGVFLRVAAGLARPLKGTLKLGGRIETDYTYLRNRERGIAFLPAARMEEGLIAGLSITEHCALQNRAAGWFVRWKAAAARAQLSIDHFRVKGMPESRVDELSGGNQQRLLLAFLPEQPELLLLENPTRGLDIESVHWVWHYLQRLCKHKTCIVFSSSDLDEIMMFADRVLVFYNGVVVEDVQTSMTDRQALGRAIAGKKSDRYRSVQ